MNFVLSLRENGIATLTLKRGKVNALNEPMVEEITQSFERLEADNQVRSIIMTGSGKFFSFGFDVPEFLNYPKQDFIRYAEKFTNLCTYMFQFPKPIVAALNGHTIAGGCMLAIACDYRLMVSGKAKISLNEITFGSSVFAGSVEMLKFCVGQKNAQSILYSGAMYSAEEALGLGLVDRVSSESGLAEDSINVAQTLAEKSSLAFKSIKSLLRNTIVEEMNSRDKESSIEMAEIWYSESTWENLKKIEIHS
jgi:3,2-trans-enoyl-CoA isomerase